jgi:hypothetical protein
MPDSNAISRARKKKSKKIRKKSERKKEPGKQVPRASLHASSRDAKRADERALERPFGIRLRMLLFSRGRRPVRGQLRGYACGAGFRSRLREEDGERQQPGPTQQVCSLVLAACVEAYSGTIKALSRLF